MTFKLLLSLLKNSPHGALSSIIIFEIFVICLLWAIAGFSIESHFVLSSLIGRVVVPFAFLAASTLIKTKIKDNKKQIVLVESIGAVVFLSFLVIPGEFSKISSCQDFEECGQFEFLELDFFFHSLCFMIVLQKYAMSFLFKLFTTSFCVGYTSFRFINYSDICSKGIIQILVSRGLIWLMLSFYLVRELQRIKGPTKKGPTDYFKEHFHFSDDFLFVVEKKKIAIEAVNKKTADLFQEKSKTNAFLKNFLLQNNDSMQTAIDPEKMVLKVPNDGYLSAKPDSRSFHEIGEKTLFTYLKENSKCNCGKIKPAKPCPIHIEDSENVETAEKTLEAFLQFSNESTVKSAYFNLKVKSSENDRFFLISAREELEKQVWDNASKVMNQVCHDIRNPASTIELLCKRAKEEADLDDKFKKLYFSTIKTSAMVIQVLAEDLLDVFLMKQGKFKLRSQVLSFKKVLGQAKKITEVQLGEKDVKVIVKIELGVPEVIRTDKDRFFQIVLNLLSNARKFTEFGNITIVIQRERQTEHMYRVSVSDTGTGMSPEFLKVIGNEGVREENAASSALNPKGIGLGLNLCRKLAPLIGPGTQGLVVESKLGEGSVFSFWVKDFQNLVQKTKIKSKAENKRKIVSPRADNGEGSTNNANFLDVNGFHTNMLVTYMTNNLDSSNQVSSFELNEKDEFDQEVEVPDEINYQANIPFLQGLKTTVDQNDDKYCIQPPPSKLQVPYDFTPNSSFQDRLEPESKPKKQMMRTQTLKKMEELKKKISGNFSVYILVADDDNFNLVFLEEQLKKLNGNGFKITKARNGKIAWEEYKKFSKKGNKDMTAVVFLDNQMPLMKGTEVAEKIVKHCERKKQLAPFLILVSGDKSEEENMKYFDFSLSKPINKRELRSLLVEMDILSEE